MKSFIQFLCAGTIAIYVAGCNPNANDELSHHHHDHDEAHKHEQHDSDHNHEGEEKRKITKG